MPTNDPARDRYNPSSIGVTDFEPIKFGDLEVDELFWQTNRPEESNPWRKSSQTQGLNLKSQTTHNFDLKTKVYQKI